MPLSDEPDPRVETLADPENPTQSLLTKCYLTYVILDGDVGKTATACNVSPAFVERHAVQEDWKSRLETTASLCNPSSRGPAEIERLLNRAALYVQASRIRRIIDTLLSEIEDRATKEGNVLGLFTYTTENGQRVDLKPIMDLSNASLRLTQITQVSMCDSVTERVERYRANNKEGEASLELGRRTLEGLSNIPVNAPDSEAVALEAIKRAKAQGEAQALAVPAHANGSKGIPRR